MRTEKLKRLLDGVGLAWLFLLAVIPGPSSPAAPAVEVPFVNALPGKTIREEGGIYRLIFSHRDEHVETEEYGLDGESTSNWSELITYQRLLLPEALGADEYVTALKHRLEGSDPTVRVRLMQATRRSAIFWIQYVPGKSDVASSQVALVLATVAHGARSRELHLVQYLVNPSRLAFDALAMKVKRWQGHFKAQAEKLAR